ncbi:MAG: 3-phosphoglycerate dehydrogenase, partial [Bacteroidetes bacterium]|nr:3-phosphoglycerate dehydrogenase [Bacteroidota bacterium]
DEGDVRFKELKKSSSKGRELYGKTLGIIGMGRIGRETARIAMGMGMNVLAHDAFIDAVDIEIRLHPDLNLTNPTVTLTSRSLDDVLKNSDFISLHIPGGGGEVIGEREINLMKPGAGLVNCARGGVVDEKALNAALISGHLSFAGLDVFETEPPVYLDILKRDEVSLSPHIGAATVEAQARIGAELADKITEILG